MGGATTVRFTDEMYARLDQASARTGMPMNSIVVAACLEWMAVHVEGTTVSSKGGQSAAPRWATLRRALGKAVTMSSTTLYPFERFTAHAKAPLRLAQDEAHKHGHSYIGTEHLLLACFGNAEFHSAKVLVRLGVNVGAVETKLDSILGREKMERRRHIVPTERVKRVIEIAFNVCSASGASLVGTHHILLALSKEGNGIAAHLLDDLGARLKQIETEVESLKDPES